MNPEIKTNPSYRIYLHTDKTANPASPRQDIPPPTHKYHPTSWRSPCRTHRHTACLAVLPCRLASQTICTEGTVVNNMPCLAELSSRSWARSSSLAVSTKGQENVQPVDTITLLYCVHTVGIHFRQDRENAMQLRSKISHDPGRRNMLKTKDYQIHREKIEKRGKRETN